ncbi:SAM-dependent methyltransferase [Pseudonocardia parietis]|uniref:SAM-dependent methyltransferase n=1 Tax=Pseudonocardia parietis TaxID=570936 RepID=A0ABS4VQ47_9PSEU|nr:SAM-dependent methyltransferase [Pseudonocardia parietis]MBP2366048.1 SAM-dependent methyltransferase [Pseudonocardia parietis]
MDRPSWAPDEVDITRPSVARVYDYYLGGSHNFEADRRFAEQVLHVLPEMATVAQANRAFLRRIVRHLCAQGVTQFLDLGSGIPTAGNVHEIASAECDDARVLYVDNDPIAVVHSRALLDGDDHTAVLAGDLTEPQRILEHPLTRTHLDLTRPVAVLLVSVLHFVPDELGPAGLVRSFVDATVPGSHVVITHASNEGGHSGANDAQNLYNRDKSPNPMRMRNADEVRALFGDLEILEPGVVRIPLWRPESPVGPEAQRYPGLAGVARR